MYLLESLLQGKYAIRLYLQRYHKGMVLAMALDSKLSSGSWSDVMLLFDDFVPRSQFPVVL